MSLRCASAALVMVVAVFVGAAATTGADAKQLSFDPKTGVAVFDIRNLSTKDITAFNLSIEAIYSDGTKRHGELSVDFQPSMLSKIEQGDLSLAAGALHPGQTEQETIGNVPSTSAGNSITSVNVAVDVIVCADGKAAVQNRAAFDRIVGIRNARYQTAREIAGILKKHSNSAESTPVQSSIEDLQALLKDKRTHSGELLDSELLATIDDLHRLPSGVSQSDFVARYNDRKQAQVPQLAAGAHIEVQQ